MSILHMSYFSSGTYSDDPDNVITPVDNVPAWNNPDNQRYYGMIGESTFYTPPSPAPAYLPLPSYKTSYKLPDTLPEELWIRYVWRAGTWANGGTSHFSSKDIATFGIINPNTKLLVPVLRIFYSEGNVSLEVTDYNGSWVATHRPTEVIGKMGQCYDTATNNVVINVRIKLSATSGFAQLYNHQNRLVGEFLGRTAPDDAIQAKPTYGTLTHTWCGDYPSYPNYPLFGVIADEKTFGLWVAPLVAKGEGSYQDQDTGSAYTSFTHFKASPEEGTHLTMTVAQNQTKRYTMRTVDFTDLKVPANYEIKAVRMAGTFETESSDGVAVPYNMIIKTGGASAQDHLYPCAEIIPNTNNTQDQRWQVRSSPILENNPTTGAAWAREDLAQLEIGFAVTGV